MNYCPECATSLVEKEIEGRVRKACPREGCGFVFWDNPVPVVAAILEWRGSVILVRQPQWPEKFCGLVAGFLEQGETTQQGVLREVQEELGLSGRVESLVGVYEFFARNQVIFAYHVVAEGEISISAELESFKAIAVEKLRPWDTATGFAVRDWLARRRSRDEPR